MTAAAHRRVTLDPVLVKVAELAVLRALEAAGKRGRLPRSVLAQALRTETHNVHAAVALATSRAECDRLLAGVWDHLCMVMPEHDDFVDCLDDFVRDLIVGRRPYDRAHLHAYLADRLG